MKLIPVAIIGFLVLEILNVIILYFNPTSKKGNGIGVFNAFEKSKEIPEVHTLVKYLINWIAGTKLIFIALLIVIIIKTDESTQTLCVFALIFSIATFYWRLFPTLKKMDEKGQLNPRGYSRTLGIMIFGFIAIFITVLLVSYFK